MVVESRVELRSGWHLRASDGEGRLWRASGDRGAEGWARACDPSARRRKAGAGYSQARYYTSLGFFVLSVPGLWLLIKRSVKSKVSPGLSSSVLASSIS